MISRLNKSASLTAQDTSEDVSGNLGRLHRLEPRPRLYHLKGYKTLTTAPEDPCHQSGRERCAISLNERTRLDVENLGSNSENLLMERHPSGL